MKNPIAHNKKELLQICKSNDIVYLGVFGSYVKGKITKGSDIDFLVRFSKPKSLFDLVRIERRFSEVLGRKADLLTEASISPYLRPKIKKEVEVFYEGTG